MLVSFLLLIGLTTRSLSRAVDADDHAFVEPVARGDEHAAALLQLPQRVGHGLAVLLADQHAVAALGHVALAPGA